MKRPVDIHTHRLPRIPGTAIVNCYPDVFAPKEGEWYSVGIHPWYVPAAITSNVRCEMNVLSSLVGHPQVLAIGEAGLDKLADAPIVVQIEVFEYQAQLSVELGKPLVIHLVKAVEELLKLKKRLQPDNPRIIHGFRGTPALAQYNVRHGFYQEESLRVVPAGRLLLETDESGVPIMELYRRASEVRGIPLDRFMEDMQENIDKVFFKR